MTNAVEAVRWKTVRRAAELYNVPRLMLSNKILAKRPLLIIQQPSPQQLSTRTRFHTQPKIEDVTTIEKALRICLTLREKRSGFEGPLEGA